jgi:hypothetical protein
VRVVEIKMSIPVDLAVYGTYKRGCPAGGGDPPEPSRFEIEKVTMFGNCEEKLDLEEQELMYLERKCLQEIEG